MGENSKCYSMLGVVASMYWYHVSSFKCVLFSVALFNIHEYGTKNVIKMPLVICNYVCLAGVNSSIWLSLIKLFALL